MKITYEQFKKIESCLPRQRGNVKISNSELVNAILYITENGCKWRALPKEYGNWHAIYMRMNRWSKNGVLHRLFEELQIKVIVRIRMKTVCPNSPGVKVPPDGTGPLKKAAEGQGTDSQPKFIWSPRLTVRL